MNRTMARNIRDYLVTIIEKNPNTLGVSVQVGNVSYRDDEATVKINVTEADQDGTLLTLDEKNYVLHAEREGLKAEWLHKTFIISGNVYTIIGLKPQSSKYPVLAKRVNGSVYKFKVDTIVKAFS